VTALADGHTVVGSTLYFTRIDDSGRRMVSGAPYCTICSKFALETGVAFFVLEHEFGIVSYPTHFYNELSFSFA
jgi:hypothetical protein